jgi:phosphoribosylformylglycinamidine cyclo-ligase
MERAAPLLLATDGDRRALDVPGFCSAIALPGGLALIATTDGVGTKRSLMADRLADLGRDLVAYNVNDVATVGVQPLAVLDYISVGALDVGRAHELLAGMADACRAAGCVLLGGETAEHPALQGPSDLDLAGFAVGIAPVTELVTGATVEPGDELVGLESGGPQASGFSLIRRAFAAAGRPVPDSFLAPTRVFVRAVAALRAGCDVRAIANICDGGLTENVPRSLPQGLAAVLDPSSWPRPAWVDELAAIGCSEDELRRVVNMGIGYTFVVARGQAGDAVELLRDGGFEAWRIGTVETESGGGRARYTG